MAEPDAALRQPRRLLRRVREAAQHEPVAADVLLAEPREHQGADEVSGHLVELARLQVPRRLLPDQRLALRDEELARRDQLRAVRVGDARRHVGSVHARAPEEEHAGAAARARDGISAVTRGATCS